MIQNEIQNFVGAAQRTVLQRDTEICRSSRNMNDRTRVLLRAKNPCSVRVWSVLRTPTHGGIPWLPDSDARRNSFVWTIRISRSRATVRQMLLCPSFPCSFLSTSEVERNEQGNEGQRNADPPRPNAKNAKRSPVVKFREMNLTIIRCPKKIGILGLIASAVSTSFRKKSESSVSTSAVVSTSTCPRQVSTSCPKHLPIDPVPANHDEHDNTTGQRVTSPII